MTTRRRDIVLRWRVRPSCAVLVSGSVQLVGLLMFAAPACAQHLLDYSPNTRAAWGMPVWQPTLILAHRFEILSGGDELISFPLVTVGTAVWERVAVGFDFTSNSEVASRNLGGNETQWWMAWSPRAPEWRGISTLLAYNTAARSVDGALTVNRSVRRLSMIGEVRAFSNALETGAFGTVVAGGASLRLTEHLRLTSDLARAVRPDTFGTVWSGGVTMSLPGTRHSFSFHASNSAAATLQGASRTKRIGEQPVRYGFAFVAPLGSVDQWAQVIGRRRDRERRDQGLETPQVSIHASRFAPDTIRVRVGESVRWVNEDPVTHTVAALDGRWASHTIAPGAQFTRTFTDPGTFGYYCEPHPHMRGVVIVIP